MDQQQRRIIEGHEPMPVNAGREWTLADDAQLVADYDGGLWHVPALAAKYGRTEAGVRARLMRLWR